MTALAAADILDPPVTRYMRFDVCKLKAEQSIVEALADVRLQHPEGRIIYFYVMDDADRLIGVVPTRRLLLSQPNAKVGEIMVPDVVTLPSTAPVRDACERFVTHKFLASRVLHTERLVAL